MKFENEAFVMEAYGDKEDVVALAVVKNLTKDGVGVTINGKGDDLIKALACIMHEIANVFVEQDNMSEAEAMKTIKMAVATVEVARGIMKMVSTSTEVQ